MTTLTKHLLGAGAAAAAMVSTASPALARDRDRDGIDAGEIIAGAVIIGGIAALAGAFSDNDDRRYRSYGDRYDGYGNPRQAVEQCVYAAERSASRNRYGRADVTDIRKVDRNRRGYTVRGRVAVNSLNRGWRSGDRQYGRGWGGDYRGWNNNLRGYDAGTFRCRVQYGRVVDLDFNGIRGL